MLLFKAFYHLIYTLSGTTYLLNMWAILLAQTEKTLGDVDEIARAAMQGASKANGYRF
jgi:hypothetical protein